MGAFMSAVFRNVEIGQRVFHPELGEGIVLTTPQNGYLSIFFRTIGERQVPLASLQRVSAPEIEMIEHIRPADAKALQRLWLSIEASQLPLLTNIIPLT